MTRKKVIAKDTQKASPGSRSYIDLAPHSFKKNPPYRAILKMTEACKKQFLAWREGVFVSREICVLMKLFESQMMLSQLAKKNAELEKQLIPITMFGKEFAARWTPTGLQEATELFNEDDIAEIQIAIE